MDEELWVQRYSNSFEQRLELARSRRTFAFGVDIGWEYAIGNKSKKIEFGYGVGVQNFKVSYDGYPSDVDISSIFGLRNAEGSRLYPFFNFSIKLKVPIR